MRGRRIPGRDRRVGDARAAVYEGYCKSPDATAAVLRDGWYWSGDIVRVDDDGFYYVVDRRKEMIRYRAFSIAPAEVESVMLEHPAVADCGVVSRVDGAGEEIPCPIVVLTLSRAVESANGGEAAGVRRRAVDALQDAARDLFRAEAAADSVGKDPAARAAEAGVTADAGVCRRVKRLLKKSTSRSLVGLKASSG